MYDNNYIQRIIQDELEIKDDNGKYITFKLENSVVNNKKQIKIILNNFSHENVYKIKKELIKIFNEYNLTLFGDYDIELLQEKNDSEPILVIKIK